MENASLRQSLNHRSSQKWAWHTNEAPGLLGIGCSDGQQSLAAKESQV